MFTTLAALAVLGQAQVPPMTCAVNNNDHAREDLFLEYAGHKVNFCCEHCVEGFEKTPAKFIETSAKNKVTVAEFYFDPVTHKKVNFKRARGTSDYMGVRYYFATADNKAAFDKDPKKFATAPKKESLHCPVMDQPVASYSKADSYVDFEGVRYFMCCAACLDPMQKEPAKYAKTAKVTEPKVIEPPKG